MGIVPARFQVLRDTAAGSVGGGGGGGGSYTDEEARDAVGGILTDSATIDFTYNDGANTITADVIDEGIQDIIGAMVAGNTETGITVTYDDTNGKLDFSVSGGGASFATHVLYGG